MLWASTHNDYLQRLESILEESRNLNTLFENIVNTPFVDMYNATSLGLGFLAFLIANKRTRILERVTISDTQTARGAINMTNVAFHDMKVPLSHKGNIVLTAIKTGRHQQNGDWHYLTDPAVSAVESRMNQAAAGISASVVYPLLNCVVDGGIIYQYFIDMQEIGKTHHNFMFRYTKLVVLNLNRFSSELKTFNK